MIEYNKNCTSIDLNNFIHIQLLTHTGSSGGGSEVDDDCCCAIDSQVEAAELIFERVEQMCFSFFYCLKIKFIYKGYYLFNKYEHRRIS